MERKGEKTPCEITALEAGKKIGGKSSVRVRETDWTVGDGWPGSNCF